MRHALVTGAARGIGKAIATRLHAAGCRVTALDRDFSGCDLDSQISRVDFDLRELSAIRGVVDGLPEIDILVNNAGVLHCPPTDQLATEGTLGFSDEMADEIWTTNVRAPVRLVEAVAPQMTARGKARGDIGGRVVNIASVSAFTGHPDLYYGASKAAVVNFTKSLARVVGRHIVINAVAPGPTVSQMFDALPQERKDATVASAYAGRAANPEEIADVVAWLGLESPVYVNGTCVDANGGFYTR